MERLSRYGTRGGPTENEAGDALHNLGSVAQSLKPDLRKGVELIITKVLEEQNVSQQRLEGAVKGAAVLGTENAGIALRHAVHRRVPASAAEAALKGMAAILEHGKSGSSPVPISGKGKEVMGDALVEALSHPSSSVRALAAEYVGRHGDGKRAEFLGGLAIGDAEPNVRHSAADAVAEMIKAGKVRDEKALRFFLLLGKGPVAQRRQQEVLARIEKRLGRKLA